MLFAIAISLLYVEIKDSVLRRVFSEIIKNFWSEWELRVMVIVSLILQFLLVYFARKRKKYIGKCVPAIAITCWLIYLSADWIATLVLSTLLRGSNDLENGLIVFWTPFLLWHLGSPYNITAYSLEDNELWLRHFLGMVFQIGEAIYIYIKFQSNTYLNAMAIPLFIAGVIKYLERIWALRCASPKQLINCFYESRSPKNFNEKSIMDDGRKMIRTGLFDLEDQKRKFVEDSSISSEVKFLREVDLSFDIFKPLFADLPLEISQEFYDEWVYLKSKTMEEAFNFVGIELEFLYDLLFTKNPIQHRTHVVSLILRGICFCSIVSVLIAFSVLQFVHHGMNTIKHSAVDTVVTYLLLSGAIYLELFSFYMHIRSKWTILRFAIPRNKMHRFYHRLVRKRLSSIASMKGIEKMAQHDLIDYCVKATSSKFSPVRKLIDPLNLLQKFWHTKWEPVDTELKEFIYRHLKDKFNKYKAGEFKLDCLEKLLGEKGDTVLQGKNPDEDWKMEYTDFTRRIFVWHIATSLVYHNDLQKHRRGICDSIRRIGKSLSDYMIYLVLVRPTMLPNGFSEIVNKQTYHQIQRIDPDAKMKDSIEDFISVLIQLPIYPDLIKTETGALFEGAKFARQLQDLCSMHRWDDEEKWQMISEVWMEMMVYAASRCTWEEHAQQLRHGGELITHVSLLMAHLGLSTQVHRAHKTTDHDHPSELAFNF